MTTHTKSGLEILGPVSVDRVEVSLSIGSWAERRDTLRLDHIMKSFIDDYQLSLSFNSAFQIGIERPILPISKICQKQQDLPRNSKIRQATKLAKQNSAKQKIVYHQVATTLIAEVILSEEHRERVVTSIFTTLPIS